jgi:P27 family predicted phage terminase small subunit
VAGRRPKPPEVKEGMGNPGKREMPTPPPRVSGVPKAPASLKGDALSCWRRVTDLLMKRHQLTQDSLESLACLAETYGERAKLRRALERKGWVMKVKTTAGEIVEKARPEVAMYQDADRRFRAWLIEFGLTDASRGKVNAIAPRAPHPTGEQPPADEEHDPAARYGLN